MTWYPESFTRVPMTNMNMRPDNSTGYPGRSYRFYTEEPVFAFGHGLSYTSFKYVIKSAPSMVLVPPVHRQGCDQTSTIDPGQCTGDELSLCGTLSFQVEVLVRNEGSRSGSTVVMLYAEPPGSGRNGVAQKSLISYQRVHLEAQKDREVVFDVRPCRDLSTVKAEGERSLDLGEHILSLGHDIRHSVRFVNADIESLVRENSPSQ